MELFESWKELVTAPNKWLSKNKGPLPLGQTIASLIFLSIFSSAILVFSSMGAAIALFFKMGQPEFFLANAAYNIVSALLAYWLIHAIACALGGKGQLLELISIPIFVSVPIAFASAALLFVPYIGKALSIAVSLLGLISVWVLYKVLRLRYKLSIKRSLAAFILGHLISSVVLLSLVAFMAYSTFVSFVESGAYAPTVTQAAGGYHLYSTMRGGYSFDYGADWKIEDWGDVNGSTKLLLSALMQNDFFSTAVFKNNIDNHTLLTLVYPLQENSVANFEETCNSMQLGRSSKVDLSEAKGTVVQWGGRQGCMIENIRDKNTGEPQSLYTTFGCGSNSIGVMGHPEDYASMMQIASTLKCGKDAVK